MGVRNHLVDGVSGSGKTSVCRELQRRGQHAVDGDTELAHQGGPPTGEPTAGFLHEHHLWRLPLVRALTADRSTPVTWFCGGARNAAQFLDLFDAVFVLDLDATTLRQRLAARPADEFGSTPEQRDLVLHLHATGQDLPPGAARVDATAPLTEVVDELLRRGGARGAS